MYPGMTEAELVTQHQRLAKEILAGKNFDFVDALAVAVLKDMMAEACLLLPTCTLHFLSLCAL